MSAVRKGEYSAKVEIHLCNLTLEELAKFEAYLKDGLQNKDWGDVKIDFRAKLVGEREIESKKGKPVTKEELLDLEKKGLKK